MAYFTGAEFFNKHLLLLNTNTTECLLRKEMARGSKEIQFYSLYRPSTGWYLSKWYSAHLVSAIVKLHPGPKKSE